METDALLGRIGGYGTIETISKILGISAKTAVKYVSFLRKQGLVKTFMKDSRKRVYYMSPDNLLQGKSYIDVLSENSPIKIAEPEPHKICGREITPEETLIYAINTKEIRFILAALGLFKRIDDWTLLGRLARKEDLKQEICALYDLARKIMKVKRMSKKFRRSAEPKGEAHRYMIEGSASKDYKDIQERWKVYLPINRADLEDYLR